MYSIILAPAGPTDIGLISALLRLSSLTDDEVEVHLPHFLTLKAGDALVGVIGLEAADQTTGLVRSLAVHPEHRGRGHARRLYETLERQAQDQGLQHLYLLTETAEGFFRKAGFVSIDRSDAPASIRQTREFSLLCPSTALCMTKPIHQLLPAT